MRPGFLRITGVWRSPKKPAATATLTPTAATITGGQGDSRGSLLSRALREVAQQAQRRIPRADLDERDPDYIREHLPLMWLLASLWYRGEVRGLGNIPEEGPVLLVGNHSGGNLTPDTAVFTLAFNAYFGVERAFYQLAHNLVLSMPGLGVAAQVRDRSRLAGKRPQGARVRRRAARLSGRRPRGSPAQLAAQPGRLRPAQGLHPPGAAAERADRPSRLDRRPGDGAVPLARRDARAPDRDRPHVPPQGAADLAGAAVGTERRRHARPHPAAGQDHRSRPCPRSTCEPSSDPIPTSTRSTTT